jgi:arylsulfatase A-like enzyme
MAHPLSCLVSFMERKRPEKTLDAELMNRLSLIVLILALLVPLPPELQTAELQTAEPPAKTERPNVLFIIADDLGIGDLGCYGNPDVETPTIDSLAKQGARLTDHYAPSPLCAPSRAGFLTGRFNHRTGAIDVPSNRGLDRIALSEKTFGDYFQHAGYETGLIGKWHNGLYCNDYLPHRRGFDLFYGFPNGGQDYWKWNLLRNDVAAPHDGRYLTDALNDEAIKFIRRSAKKEKPFALFLAHHAPHSPYQAPAELIQKYRRRLGEDDHDKVANIYAMIEAMDTGLGRVFDALREQGQWERTIIVFTSDNGAYLGRAEGGSTHRFHASFSGNKGDVGEQGIRVPAIVSWPGRIPRASIVTTPIHGCDWLPTLYGLTTTAPPSATQPLDGLNVMPTLLGERQSELDDRNLPFQKNRYMPAAHSDAAIRRGKWKLVWPGAIETMKKDSTRDNPSYLRGIVRPHWEMPLDRQLSGVPEFQEANPRLFDLATDPAERHDIARQHPRLVAELVGDYDRWFASVMVDWLASRQSILSHDRAFWRNRPVPDPAVLYRDFWLWDKTAADRKASDPLKVFRGFWNSPP